MLGDVLLNVVYAAVLQHRITGGRHWRDRKNLRIVERLLGD